MSAPPSPPSPQNWRKPALVFLAVLVVGGGVGWYVLDRTSAARRDGLAAAQAGDFKKAEPLLKKALERDPAAADVAEALARGYLKTDDAANAELYLGKWVELRPDDAEPRKMRVAFYRSRKMFDEAYPDNRKLLALDPGNSQLRRSVMGMAFSVGDFAEAESLCRACIRDFPGDSGLLVMLANILRARGDTAGAVAILDPLVKQSPPHLGATLARAVLHEEADQPAEAIPLLREVLKRDKSVQRTAGMRLAVMLERTGQKAEAEKVMAEVRRLQDVLTIEEGVATQPANLELRVRQGEEMLASGYHADGVKMLLSVFDYDRGYRPAHRALAAHFEKTGQPDRAAQHRRAAGDPR